MSEFSNNAENSAESQGLAVVRPGVVELFIDADNFRSVAIMRAHIDLLAQNGFPLNETRCTESKSGGQHRHYYLDGSSFGSLTDTERIAIQACLGSDLKRELLSFLRVKRGVPDPTLFFERKVPA